MDYEIVILEEFTGEKATIYSIILDKEEQSLYDNFYDKYISLYKSEIENILSRLETMGHKTGARVDFFKQYEGNPGDGVCALFDVPDSNLRLYCIRYGSSAIILGDGGYKPKSISSLQDDPILKETNEQMRQLSKDISQKIKDGVFEWSPDGTKLLIL